MKRTLVSSVLIAGLFALWMRSCNGPSASVRGVRQRGDVAVVSVHNASRGSGDLAVSVRAFPADGGAPVAGSQKVELQPFEDVDVPVEVKSAGDGARLEADVQYPPR